MTLGDRDGAFRSSQGIMIRERAKDHGSIIADGYTNPVRSREDLVRHGYLRAEAAEDSTELRPGSIDTSGPQGGKP